MLGDIIRSLQPGYLTQMADAIQSNVKGMAEIQVDEFCETLGPSVASWEQLLESISNTAPKEGEEERLSSRTTSRLFGHSKPMVTLYRDSAAWCPYCQKTWMALEETRVPYEIVKIDMRCYGKGKPTEFLKLQPNGNLPCAIINSREGGTQNVVRESNDIIDALDELSSSVAPTLRPVGHEDRIRAWCDNGRDSLERRLYARWMWWLTGVRRPQEYKDLFLEHWQEMEDALGEVPGPYFLGKEISVVDLRFIPFVERQLASLAYFKGADYLRDPNRYPNVVRWLEAMESRASFQVTKSDYYTHSRALPPQLAADCAAEPGCEELQESIDSWPVLDGSRDWKEPGWEWCESGATKEAADRLVQGNRNIVAFCARGAGVSGLPAASAPLADPGALPNESAIPALDLLIRYIATSLLQKSSACSGSWLQIDSIGSATKDSVLFTNAVSRLDNESALSLADCLDYLRARIGVPRDMSYPAAQALRKELLFVSNILRGNTNGSVTPVEGISNLQAPRR